MRSTNGHFPDTLISLTAIDLERQVLGAALIDNTACALLVQHLEPQHLADTKNRHPRILSTIHKLFREATPVNVDSVARTGDLDQQYLSLLIRDLSTTSNVFPHALIIKERWMGRQAIRSAQRMESRIKGGDDIFDVLDDHQKEVSEFVLGHSGDTHIRQSVNTAVQRSYDWEKGKSTDYCPTGFYNLDGVIGGYPIGELTTLAAHTGAGKTSIITQVVKSLAKIQAKKGGNEAVLIFSAEMNSEQIAHKLASNEAGIDLYDLRRQSVSKEIYDKYRSTLNDLLNLNIHIDDIPTPSLSHITARCQQLQAQYGLMFACVDYDERIDTEGDTEELRVSAIARGLKDIAKRFMIPIVALSQYSRAAGYSESPSDDWLRYSGKKAHESAVILHWFYPAYWVQKGVAPEKVAKYDVCGDDSGYIICTKNRFGKTGKIKLEFQRHFTRFIDHGDPDKLWWENIPPPDKSPTLPF